VTAVQGARDPWPVTKDGSSGVRRPECLRVLAVFLLGVQAVAAAAAADFTIEDRKLATLPQDVEIAIRARTGSEFTSCRLVGKPVDLTGKGAHSGYVATTAQGCGWERPTGPVWVVLVADGAPRVVLSDRSHSLTVGKQKGIRNLATSARTATWYRETLWKFDGKVYRSVKSYNFTADDKATCEAHPKVCPFK
jgi:hypothetical protein